MLKNYPYPSSTLPLTLHRTVAMDFDLQRGAVFVHGCMYAPSITTSPLDNYPSNLMTVPGRSDHVQPWSKTNRARMTILPPCKCCAAKQWHAETQPLPVHWPQGVQWYLCFWVCFWLLFPFSQMFCPLVGKKGLFCWDYTPQCEGWSSTFWVMVWFGLSSAPQLCNDLEVTFCCKSCFFLFERSCRTG